MSLASAAVPPVGPEDHARGEGPVVIEYMDFQCPHCAEAHAKLAGLAITRVFRHFPIASKHPRARILAHAAESAALQDRFWEFHDSLYEDHGRLDDPHLWARCEELGLDLDRFEADRRSDAVAERVERDFRGGVRAGITTTPTLFVDGHPFPGVPEDTLLSALRYAQ